MSDTYNPDGSGPAVGRPHSRGFPGLLAPEPDRGPDIRGDADGRADAGDWEDAGGQGRGDHRFLTDLRIDQIIAAITGEREDCEYLTGLLSQRVTDAATITYRHEVFADLEDDALLDAARTFSARMRQVRAHLSQLPAMISERQREGWFLDAVAIYCDALRSVAAALASRPVSARGLISFRDYLGWYLDSAPFGALAEQTSRLQDEMATVSYLVRIKGVRVEVSRYDDEPDYSAEIERTFERFRQGAVKDYRITYRSRPGMNHVGARILDLVARLYPAEFGALREHHRRHGEFIDPVIARFERELGFYLAYLEYIGPLRRVGLRFCLPEITTGSKDIFARDAFDLALASRVTLGGGTVVPNDLELRGDERVIVVSGPNQGGKTTFARTFGQLHHLAGIGCPVPARQARLYLCDQIFTHFEREEDLANLTGKLEDDLLRIQQVLRAATPDSVVIMNEIFTATTVADARFLGQKVLQKIVELDLLCVYVTFIDELASYAGSVVSMMSTIAADDPARRTYKVLRRPADGLAYALAIADKHRVSYELLRKRVAG